MIEGVVVGIAAAFIAVPIGVSLDWPIPVTMIFSVGLAIFGALVVL